MIEYNGVLTILLQKYNNEFCISTFLVVTFDYVLWCSCGTPFVICGYSWHFSYPGLQIY